jgi:hypothetical protein
MTDNTTIALDLQLRLQNAESIKELKDIIQEAEGAATSFGNNSSQAFKSFNEVALQANEKLDGLKNNLSGLDPTDKIGALAQMGKTMTDGFAAASSAAKLFGVSSQGVGQAIEKAHKTALAQQKNQYQAEQNAAAINAQKLKEIELNYQKDTDAIKAEYSAKGLEREKQDAQARTAIMQDFVGIAQASAELLGAAGKRSNDIQKAVTLEQIVMDTASAISSLTRNSEANVSNAADGGLTAVAVYATGIARILANVAKAKQLLSSSGSGDASVSASPGSSLYSAAQPSMGITSPSLNTPVQATYINTDKAEKNGVNSSGVKIYVTETDISNVQERVARLKKGGVI